MTELKRYFENGTLEINCTRWQPIDRLRSGELLQNVAYKSGIYIKAQDPSKPRIDISGFKPVPTSVLIAKDMYTKAIKQIPQEHWPIVRLVVVEDRKIQHVSRAEVFLDKWRLCVGLDYLCDFYAKILGQRHQIEKI